MKKYIEELMQAISDLDLIDSRIRELIEDHGPLAHCEVCRNIRLATEHLEDVDFRLRKALDALKEDE